MALSSVTILDYTGLTEKKIGTNLVGDVHYQLAVPYQQSRSDTFTVAANGTTVDVSDIPVSRFGLQVKGTGATPTAWEVVLEGSLNGTQFTTIATHKNGIDADGATHWQAQPAPAKYFRSRLVSITLGSATNVIATIIGEAGS
jgi:hypothetical protein